MGLPRNTHVKFKSSSADSLDVGVGIETIIVDFQCFELVPHERMLTLMAASGMELRLVVWLRNVLVGRTQRVTGGGHLFKEVKVTSGVTERSVLGPLLFPGYVNHIWGSIDSCIRHFDDDSIIYGKTNK
jgi:hypothetical protein